MKGARRLQAGETGASRVVVYFNATLTLAGDYSFGGWDQLGSSSVAYALGATDKGIFGLEAENRAGDLVRAYGSAIYEQSADGWMPVAAAQPNAAATAAPNLEGTAPSTASKQLIDQLAGDGRTPATGRAGRCRTRSSPRNWRVRRRTSNAASSGASTRSHWRADRRTASTRDSAPV